MIQQLTYRNIRVDIGNGWQPFFQGIVQIQFIFFGQLQNNAGHKGFGYAAKCINRIGIN